MKWIALFYSFLDLKLNISCYRDLILFHKFNADLAFILQSFRYRIKLMLFSPLPCLSHSLSHFHATYFFRHLASSIQFGNWLKFSRLWLFGYVIVFVSEIDLFVSCDFDKRTENAELWIKISSILFDAIQSYESCDNRFPNGLWNTAIADMAIDFQLLEEIQLIWCYNLIFFGTKTHSHAKNESFGPCPTKFILIPDSRMAWKF